MYSALARPGLRWVFYVALCSILMTSNFGVANGQPSQTGEWAPPFEWPNVAVHLHVLPTGKVLFFARRELGEGLDPGNANEPATRNSTPRLWDPQTGLFSVTKNQPGFNVFCSGHTFLADGRLLVAGGHIEDSKGEPDAAIYDPFQDEWSKIEDMPNDPRMGNKHAGRWYPTLLTLPNGDVFVAGGTNVNREMNIHKLIWNAQTGWKTARFANGDVIEHMDITLYPRMHVTPDGRAILTGHRLLTQMVDPTGAGTGWDNSVGNSNGPVREDGCSVLYDHGKVLIVGGGRGPVKTAQILDLNDPNPSWQNASAMKFERRHHNATLLPDGTVLVTGGTRSGPPNNVDAFNGFNDVRPNRPVHTPELWDPTTNTWTELADEAVDRCYHSTAVLLPDARVLSAGGGEWRPGDVAPNDAVHNRTNGQIFSPPYLFKSTPAKPRPDITNSPDDVAYGAQFTVGTSHADQVEHVNLLRLSSVTHQCNLNQRICKLSFQQNAVADLLVTAPADSNACPPGHYLMFLLNDLGVPSIAKIIRIHD